MRRNQIFEHDQMKENIDHVSEGYEDDKRDRRRFWGHLILRLVVLGVIILGVILVIVLR